MAQSAAVKEAKGNPGRHKSKRRRYVDRSSERKDAPRQLKKSGLAIWKDLAPELRKLSFLRETDAHAFARYCTHLAQWWKLNRDLEAKGYVQVTDSDHVKMERARPGFLIRERIENRLEKLEDRFGMNPAARQQILLRMANQLPLFADKPNGTDQQNDNPASPVEPESPPSAIGFLRPSTAVN